MPQKVIESAKFYGGEDVLHIRLVQATRPPFKVVMQRGDGDGESTKGTVATAQAEEEARERYAVAIADAQAKGWTLAPGKGSLVEIPPPSTKPGPRAASR